MELRQRGHTKLLCLNWDLNPDHPDSGSATWLTIALDSTSFYHKFELDLAGFSASENGRQGSSDNQKGYVGDHETHTDKSHVEWLLQ